MPTPTVVLLDVRSPADGSLIRYVSSLTRAQVDAKGGLRAEGIIGWLKDSAGAVEPGNFIENAAYVRFLHATIGRHFEKCPGLIAEGRRIRDGYVYVLDGRTPRVGNEMAAEDLLGMVEARGGELVDYRPAEGYRLFTNNGFPMLEPWLYQRFIEELLALPVVMPGATGTVAP